MIINLKDITPFGGTPIALRCPACRQNGTFDPIPNINDISSGRFYMGQRRCPNPQCLSHVFCILDSTGKVIRSYPPERIDFDPINIPPPIAKTFTDALACRAENLHVAAAIMIRRTLEELCENKEATGADLKARISALKSSVVLPQALFDSLDDLRFLGNDAAHIEAKTFNSIGEDELDIAIELTKEILKAVYQLEDLLTKFRALKKVQPHR